MEITTDEAVSIGIVPKQLTEDNYEYWKVCLKNYLIGHGLWDHVISKKEGIPKRGTPEYEIWEKSPKQYENWRRKNALALHAIQLSCGSDLYFKFLKSHSAKEVWDRLAEKRRRASHSLPADHEDEEQRVPPISPFIYHDEVPIIHEMEMEGHLRYEGLRKRVEDGDKNVVIDFRDNLDVISVPISSNGDTALHIAILAGHEKIAEKLVQLMPKDSLAMTNKFGSTPLSLATISGSTKLAKAMVAKNTELVSIANEHEDGLLPVILAALYGRKHMVHYLYTVTPLEELSPEKGNPPGERGATLLNYLITAEIYDVASDLLKKFPHLAFTKDHDDNYTIKILAHKQSAFRSGTRHGFWKKMIYSCISVHSQVFAVQKNESHGPGDEENPKGPLQGSDHLGNSTTSKVPSLLHKLSWMLLRCFGIKHIYERKLVHHKTNELLSCIFEEMKKLSLAQLDQMGIDEVIHTAIKHGIVEFIVEILKVKPDFIWRKDNKGRTIFSHAILQRQEKIFSLIYAFGTKTSIMARRHDIFHNNFLHLAANLSPRSRLEHLSGAALQMQRELLWFKEVESMVQPKYKEETNENHKTPITLFTEEHEELVKAGEKWMKHTAGSSMVVGTLIAAVMFTTTFTVPGGTHNETGLPLFLGQKAFLIFIISNALAMLTSSTSVLMFLGILTARYAEEDFLVSLPTKLILGLATLFFSIVTMMIAFGSALQMMLHEIISWVSIPVIIFSAIPITIFSALQFPLLLEMIIHTYKSGIFDRSKKLPH